MDLEHARGFVAVVAHGSIAGAAEALGRSRPALSRQVAALERSLGVALLHRTARQVGPTAEGRRLVDALRPLLEEADRVAGRFGREAHEVTGRLTVSVPPALAVPLTDLLWRYQAAHPGLEVVLQSTAQRVDLRDGTVDVALRAGALHDPDLVCRRLGARAIRAWASPAYLARRGVPATVADLEGHTLLRTLALDGQPRPSWPLRDGGRVAVTGRFASDDQRALRHLAAAGEGICLLDDGSAAGGDLVPVLDGVVGTELEVWAVVLRRGLQPARVRGFLEAVGGWV